MIGTTLAMMAVNIPVVLIGNRLADKPPIRAMRITTAIVFATLGVVTLFEDGP